VVDSFIAALRAGDFEGLIAVLDPQVIVHIDEAAAGGAPREIRGAADWAKGAIAFARLAPFVRPMLVDGAVGAVLAPQGRLSRLLRFTIRNGRIAEVDIIADPVRLQRLDLAVFES
jgi:RNA polymerase sigma-70 factor (ECF subfamily)